MDPATLIFAGFAIFVIFKLISVLGTRQGHEPRRDVEGLQRARRPEERPDADRDAPAEREAAQKPLAPVSAAAEPLRAADPTFDEKAFLAGAKGAYEMIVEAFAAGDLKSIRRYIAPPVHEAFKAALAAREAAGQSMELKFVGIDKATIVEADVEGGEMSALVEFFSNQVRVVRDASSAVVEGDPNRIDLVRDRWRFARKIGAADPNWTLVATAGGD